MEWIEIIPFRMGSEDTIGPTFEINESDSIDIEANPGEIFAIRLWGLVDNEDSYSLLLSDIAARQLLSDVPAYLPEFRTKADINPSSPTDPAGLLGPVIDCVPLEGEERSRFIAVATAAFDEISDRMEPDHDDLTRALWDPEDDIDHHLFRADDFPIPQEEALILLEHSLVSYFANLAAEADAHAERRRTVH